jgi:hypothetical protein
LPCLYKYNNQNIIALTTVGAVFVSLSAALADRLLTLYKSNPFSYEKAGFYVCEQNYPNFVTKIGENYPNSVICALQLWVREKKNFE